MYFYYVSVCGCCVYECVCVYVHTVYVYMHVCATTQASKRKSTGSAQRFLKTTTSEEGDQPVPTTSSQTILTPQYYGIHVYSDVEIDKAVGLQKQFKTFWNEKASEICADKSFRGRL